MSYSSAFSQPTSSSMIVEHPVASPDKTRFHCLMYSRLDLQIFRAPRSAQHAIWDVERSALLGFAFIDHINDWGLAGKHGSLPRFLRKDCILCPLLLLKLHT